MLRAPATMAMFMLRLSGLLSLDPSLNTSSAYTGLSGADYDTSQSWVSPSGRNYFPQSDHSHVVDGSVQDDGTSSTWQAGLFYTTPDPGLPPIASPLIANNPAEVTEYPAKQDVEITGVNLITNASIPYNTNVTNTSAQRPFNVSLPSNESFVAIPPSSMEGLQGNVSFNSTVPTASGLTPNDLDLSFGNIKPEELLEDLDEILDLAQEGSETDELKEPAAEFVPPNFEYYDFSADKDTLYMPPTLTSHNLVSPVPYPRPRATKTTVAAIARSSTQGSNSASGGSITSPGSNSSSDSSTSSGSSNSASDINETFDPNQVTEQVVPVAKKKSLRPVIVNPDSKHRNNPYPYGPLFLPGYTETSAGAIVNTRRRATTTTTQPPGEEYDYEYEAYDYKENTRKVQTESPPVLFHFEGPGYVPQAPSTTAPPVRAPTPSDPWDCSPRCPNYTLEDWNPSYDIRRYPDMTWMSTIIIDKERVLAELEGYMRLQDYFYGLNDRGQVLNLSVPFITQIKLGRHPGVLSELNDYTISLHVPPGAAGVGYELPTPISNEVLIDTLEPKTVFVSSFEAEVWEVTGDFLEQRVQTLMARLRSNGEAFLDRYYYLASYSRPELYQPVYYEVWVYATSLRNPRPPPPEPHPRPRMAPISKITRDTMQRLCRGVECPSFEVIRTYKYGIQKRRYFDVVFASVSPGDCYFSTLAIWKGFMPLHLYKHGINSHMEVVEATRPIAVVRVEEDSTPNTECPQNLTMSLFLPRRLHSAPPVTGYTAPGPVLITSLEDVMVFAYTVGGYLLDPHRVRKELSDLKYRLTEFGACFSDDIYYIVVYDFIARYHGRQNEIWIVAENCRATRNG